MAGGDDRARAGKPPPPPPSGDEEGFVVADKALHLLGFEFTTISEREVAGRLPVTDTCCQPFGVLNGGVSALVAESAASIGAYMASGGRRVAGVQLSVNHLRPARLGDLVHARATPVQLGRSIQVWEVQIWRVDPSTGECKDDLVSTARVTMLAASPTRPEEMTGHEASIKKHAKL
ncbi:unnamed protein product [Urochloa decumbens]|uniref:HotDog ACOT-type domain-containing protein n=1 Tax=Urochloa decumbens TaxID=240449 RepID=A0ABC9H668_9POAL